MNVKLHPGETTLSTLSPQGVDILNEDALSFIHWLARSFGRKLATLLEERKARQARFDAGEVPDFLEATASIRRSGWTVAPLPRDLRDRRVEITGPPERKMLVNALNSGAKVYMADFEDSLAPTLENLVQGQANLAQAVRRTLRFQDPMTGRAYGLDGPLATLMVRPRGLHLTERHFEVDGEAVPACLFDAGLFLFHNAEELLKQGSGPYLYLPKLEHHLEARWWNSVLESAEAGLGLPMGSVRTTMLLETLPAAFQMDEILHEHRTRAVGLNLGRWDYIFSYLKTLRRDPARILPDRALITMDQPFLRACSRLMIHTCHKRGCHAMGGMSAFVPFREDPERTNRAFAQVRQDKRREVEDGCDGAWVAHPALVPVAQAEFDLHMAGPNQIHRLPAVQVTAGDLLEAPEGARTEAGLRRNLRVGIQYLESWLRGQGCVAIDGLMEDAATAEIARMQLWQWIHHGVELEGCGHLDPCLFHRYVLETLQALRSETGEDAFEYGRYGEASELLEALILDPAPAPFLTLPAYELLLRPTRDEEA